MAFDLRFVGAGVGAVIRGSVFAQFVVVCGDDTRVFIAGLPVCVFAGKTTEIMARRSAVFNDCAVLDE